MKTAKVESQLGWVSFWTLSVRWTLWPSQFPWGGQSSKLSFCLLLLFPWKVPTQWFTKFTETIKVYKQQTMMAEVSTAFIWWIVQHNVSTTICLPLPWRHLCGNADWPKYSSVRALCIFGVLFVWLIFVERPVKSEDLRSRSCPYLDTINRSVSWRVDCWSTWRHQLKLQVGLDRYSYQVSADNSSSYCRWYQHSCNSLAHEQAIVQPVQLQ